MLVPGVRKRVAAGMILFGLFAAGCARARSGSPGSPGADARPPAEPPPPPAALEPARKEPPPEPEGPPSPLDGVPARDEAAVRRRPIAVMIDNHPSARPQTGLSKAEVVYEILAEGGITRFMALFLREQPDVVGPVRSARHYFVQLAAEPDAYYVHAGFSPQARVEIDRLHIADVDDMRGAGGFFRVTDRRSPHNLYVSLPKARAWGDQRGWRSEEGPKSGLRFAREARIEGTPARSVRVVIPAAFQGYAVEYAYDEAKGVWLRSINGEPHVDAATSEQLAARTVVLQFVATRAVPGDADGRIDMDLVGSGRARIFSGGKALQARWSKSAVRAPTSFADAEGKPVEFPPGQVWIHVLPPDAEVTVQ